MTIVSGIMNKYKRVPITVKATVWFIIASTLQKSISFLTTPIFTRMMSPAQFGQYSVYTSWLNMLTILVTLRLNWAAFNKGMSRFKDDRYAYTSTMQTITALLTAFFLLIYLLFKKQINILFDLPAIIILLMFAEMFVTPAIDFWTVQKRYEYQYKPVVIKTLLYALFNSVIGIVAVVFSEEKGYARILSCVFVNLVFGLTVFTYNRKRGKVWFRKEYAVFALTFVLPLLLHYFSQYVLGQFDRIMIQKMAGIAAAGLYSVAYNAGMVMKLITQNINSALVPWQYGKLEKNDILSVDNTMYKVYIGVAICLFIFISFAPEAMYLLADKEYYEAVYVIPPVAMGLFFLFMYTTIANVEFYYEETRFTIYISVAGALLNIVLNFFGITYFGYVAAAYTTLICYIYFSIAHYIYTNHCVKRKCGISKAFNLKRLTLVSLAFVICSSMMTLLYGNLLVRFVIIGVLLIILYIKRDTLTQMIKIVELNSSGANMDKNSLRLSGDENGIEHNHQDGQKNEVPVLFQNKLNCCGCSACYSVCPVHAIEMKVDCEGFLYPVIDERMCIRCNHCLSVCIFKAAQIERGLKGNDGISQA